MIVPLTALGQADLTETFTASDDSFSFLYPDGWSAVEEDNGIATLSNEEGTIVGSFLPPGLVEANFTGADDLDSVLVAFLEFVQLDTDDRTEVTIGGRDALRSNVAFPGSGENGIVIVIEFSDRAGFGVVFLSGPKADLRDAEELLLEVVATFDLPGAAEPVRPQIEVGDTNQLINFNAGPEDTIAELVVLGIIEEGGSLILEQDFESLSGQGNQFIEVGDETPATNYVLSGEINFQAGNTNDIELCSLSSRIEKNRQGDAVTFINVGLSNAGLPVIVDRFSDQEDPGVEIGTTAVNLRNTNHLLVIVIDDRATVYVNGELAIDGFLVEEREGIFGIGLLAQTRSTSCEVTNIWAYEVTGGGSGGGGIIGGGGGSSADCTVTASRTVNKRTGPGTNFDTAGSLDPGDSATAVGQAQGRDNFVWWLLDDDTWVREDVVTEDGNCEDLPSA